MSASDSANGFPIVESAIIVRAELSQIKARSTGPTREFLYFYKIVLSPAALFKTHSNTAINGSTLRAFYNNGIDVVSDKPVTSVR